MTRRNIVTISLTLTKVGLDRFKRTPVFNNMLHPNQISQLVVGTNKLNVNHTQLGSLRRAEGWDAGNIIVKISKVHF